MPKDKDYQKFWELVIAAGSIFKGADNKTGFPTFEEDEQNFIVSILEQASILSGGKTTQKQISEKLESSLRTRYKKFLDKDISMLMDSSETESEFLNGLKSVYTELSYAHLNLSLIFDDQLKDCVDQKIKDALAANKDINPAFGASVAFVNEINDELTQKKNKLEKETLLKIKKEIERMNSTSQDFLEKVQAISDRAGQTADEIREELGSARSLVSDAAQQSKDIIPNVLTILGIFIAIIVALTGGFGIVREANAISFELKQVNFAYFLLMGHILFDLFFVLMFMIARLSNSSIAISGCGTAGPKHGDATNDCSKCIHHSSCHIIDKLWKKYPYVAFINWAAVMGYIILWTWWYVEKYIYSKIPKCAESILFAILIIACYGFMIHLFLEKKRSPVLLKSPPSELQK